MIIRDLAQLPEMDAYLESDFIQNAQPATDREDPITVDFMMSATTENFDLVELIADAMSVMATTVAHQWFGDWEVVVRLEGEVGQVIHAFETIIGEIDPGRADFDAYTKELVKNRFFENGLAQFGIV